MLRRLHVVFLFLRSCRECAVLLREASISLFNFARQDYKRSWGPSTLFTRARGADGESESRCSR